MAAALGGDAAAGVGTRAGDVCRTGAHAQPPGPGGTDAALAGLAGAGRRLEGGARYALWLLALAVDYCFRSMGLHRIEIAIRPENVRSLRVVEKLGFRPEGLRPRYLHIDGDWRDHLVFALNAEEVPEGLLRRWDNQRRG